MPTPIDDAYDDCIRGVFDVFVDNLMLADGAKDRPAAEVEATAKFLRGCAICERARDIANKVGPIAQQKE